MPLEHQPRHYRDKRRASPKARGYDSKWAAAAAGFKRSHPYCLGCHAVGLVVATEVVDHIVPHRGDRAIFWNSHNWQPACSWHHNAIKRLLEDKFERSELNADALRLDSKEAMKLTKARRIVEVGADGWPIHR